MKGPMLDIETVDRGMKGKLGALNGEQLYQIAILQRWDAYLRLETDKAKQNERLILALVNLQRNT